MLKQHDCIMTFEMVSLVQIFGPVLKRKNILPEKLGGLYLFKLISW